jgi:CBS domain containing-hemolysin-like protein
MVVPQPDELADGWLTRVMRILFGWKAAATRADFEQVLTAAEEAQSGFSPEEAAMLKNILGLREMRIESVMVPRTDIIAVQQDIAIGELLRVFERAGHSRLVVYNDSLDDPTGMVHIRDLIAFMAARASQDPATAAQETVQQPDLDFTKIDLSIPLTVAKILREILYAPPSMPAVDLLAKMQATRIHLALVIDEYGGTDGLVSMEDLVELIVGDIADEHDEREMPAVLRQSDGSFIANGRASLDDVRAVIGEEFDVGDAGRDVDTLGGYLMVKAGRLPVRGELVPGPPSFEAEVLDADPRRIKRVKIYRAKDRRPSTPRDLSAPAKAPALRPAPRDDANRPNPNSPQAP